MYTLLLVLVQATSIYHCYFILAVNSGLAMTEKMNEFNNSKYFPLHLPCFTPLSQLPLLNVILNKNVLSHH